MPQNQIHHGIKSNPYHKIKFTNPYQKDREEKEGQGDLGFDIINNVGNHEETRGEREIRLRPMVKTTGGALRNNEREWELNEKRSNGRARLRERVEEQSRVKQI